MAFLMSRSLLEKKILEETKNLSIETLKEILDFIRFKKLKARGKGPFEKEIRNELTDLGESSLIHLEEEFFDYKKCYPREQ